MVATPIGNIEDISFRAVKILDSVKLILAEDTRKSLILLNNYSIRTKVKSFHEYSNSEQIKKYIELLKSGYSIALISDAGSPLISDPGFELVHEVLKENINVSPIPGANSAISALIASGLKVNKFIFEGFPPRKISELKNYLKGFLYEERTIIFFESPRRIKNLLSIMIGVLGKERKVVLAREITKMHENFYSGSASNLLKDMEHDGNLQKGEMVFLIEGTSEKQILSDDLEDRLVHILLEQMPLRNVSKIVSKISKSSSREIYNKFQNK